MTRVPHARGHDAVELADRELRGIDDAAELAARITLVSPGRYRQRTP